MLKKFIIGTLLLLLLLSLLALAGRAWLKAELASVGTDETIRAQYFEQLAARPEFAAGTRQDCLDSNPQRNAYFGELHVHTTLSQDSVAFGNLAGPAEAYDFARGAPLRLEVRGQPVADAPTVQLREPLDFVALTDHAEHLGETHLCMTPGTDAYDSSVCKVFRGDWVLPVDEVMQPLARMLALVFFGTSRSIEVCGDDGRRCIDRSATIWQQQQRAAELAYDRSEQCSFTSFVAYEYSLARNQANLHRNVIFANAAVPPVPLSAKDEPDPAGLWRWLKDYCVESDTGCDALAIPHNANWSSGRMFFPPSLLELPEAEQRERAALRASLEPLVEIFQVKGDSECRNGIASILGGFDELCDFEKLRPPAEVIEDCGDTKGAGGMSLGGCLSGNGFVRSALLRGLEQREQLGVNPFEMGILAATDNHQSASGAVNEASFRGSTSMDTQAERRMSGPRVVPGVAKGDTTRYNPGGLAGVWAEENTRESLFAAMKRRETFGTSGPRIQPRMFAGWALDTDLCDAPDMLAQAYAQAVPMGSTLKAPGARGAPRFLLSAQKDTLDGRDLEKIQVIKGWLDSSGQLQQQVIDVAGGSSGGALASLADVDVDSIDCDEAVVGQASLCTVWEDPAFDPSLSAVYYARIVQTPSCRWSTYDCQSIPAAQRPETCRSADIPARIRERAWTSPIWYYPDGSTGGSSND